ncbi:chorismate mutase [Schaalia sp. ZJ405]|uniref:chorismate mutase n=2 Tax=unclassified Schaalia TaxID=2691889 RepID=UPI0013EC8FEE|nr:chorismate mutase [Schaalia sp. ZJ405]
MVRAGLEDRAGAETSHVLTGAAGPADPPELAIPAELAAARATIDNIDAALIHILAERFRCTQRVGHIKAVHHLPPADPEREGRQISRLRALAEQSGLDPDFAEKFLSFMVTEVIRHHEDIRAEYHAGTPDADESGVS